MNKTIFFPCLLSLSIALFGQNNSAEEEFRKLSASDQWISKFNDDCTGNWKNKWFMDGVRSDVTNTPDGMVLSAGPVLEDHACQVVLWTKDSFKGDIKIEFDYTRTDTRINQVNIIYIQATGIGKPPYSKDITEWNNLRIIPYMNTYYQYMNLLHISYAAFDNEDNDGIDYIRARRYPVLPGANFDKTTELPPASFGTGLFNPGETYRITIIKANNKLYFSASNKNISRLYNWDLSIFPPVTEGRVGLRHMYARSAMYKNIKICIK